MQEIRGNLWDFYDRPNHIVCITTNGFVKNDGSAVMGRGCALEATTRFPWMPRALGKHIKEQGNVAHLMYTSEDQTEGVFIFPVKHNWWETADLSLIEQSARKLAEYANGATDHIFILPKPGCGNGKLDWSLVREQIKFLPDNVLVIDFA